jgi:putative acetyltransferase
LIIRPERPGEEAAIAAVQLAAFGKEVESRIPELVRATAEFVPELSLVAENEGEIVGHVLLSYVRLGERRVLQLGPIGVVPERQGEGIGSALVREGLRLTEERGEPMVVLEGNPRYYSRFGFVSIDGFGIEPLPPAQVPYVQIHPLSAYDDSWRGELEYTPPFTV